MQYLQTIRLVDELRACHDRLDHDAVTEHLGYLRSRVATVLESYAGADASKPSEQVSSPALRTPSIAMAPAILEMVDRDRAFVTNHLIPSGLLSATAANSELLVEIAMAHPTFFPDRSVVEFRKLGPTSSVVEASIRQLEESRGHGAETLTFFSPSQAEHDLSESFDLTERALGNLEDHNTNWLKVGLGALRVAGGLVAKAGGAIACATGAGCIVGGAAIVSGTGNVIGGAMDIVEGLEEE